MVHGGVSIVTHTLAFPANPCLLSPPRCNQPQLSSRIPLAFSPLSTLTSPLLPLTSTSAISKTTIPPMAGNLRRRTGVKTTFIPNVSEPPSLPRPNVPQNHRINRSIKVISKAALEKTTENNRNLPSILSGDRGTLVIIITHLLLSTVFLAISEGWALLDALYFSVVIATTVGYGDITPIRPISKIFVAIYAIVSVAIIANLLQSLVERFAVAQRKMAKSARSIVLGISNDTLLQNSESTDLVVTSRLAVSRSVLRLRATMIMFLGACISGIVLYKYFLKESLVDVIYFLCISMTTVGLGDIHPKTQFGKAFATIWLVFTSLGFANILSQFADVKLKEREHETASKILSGNMSDKMFNEIDGDGDNTLSEAEYLGYIICKMGKSSPDDVRSILLRFRHLDSDGSGFITKQDLDITVEKHS